MKKSFRWFFVFSTPSERSAKYPRSTWLSCIIVSPCLTHRNLKMHTSGTFLTTIPETRSLYVVHHSLNWLPNCWFNISKRNESNKTLRHIEPWNPEFPYAGHLWILTEDLWILEQMIHGFTQIMHVSCSSTIECMFANQMTHVNPKYFSTRRFAKPPQCLSNGGFVNPRKFRKFVLSEWNIIRFRYEAFKLYLIVTSLDAKRRLVNDGFRCLPMSSCSCTYACGQWRLCILRTQLCV